MKKINLSVCKICNKTLTHRGFSFHVSQTHVIKIEDYIIKYVYNGIHPTCLCGCGEPVTIRMYHVMDYIDHHSDGGKFNKDSIKNRDHDKWLEKTSEGIRKYNQEQKRLNPDYRKGKNNNSYGFKHSEKTKEKLRNAVKKQISDGKHPFIGNDNGRIRGSKLEDRFQDFLNQNNILSDHNFKLPFEKNGKIGYKYYDFYISETNILIEIHGNYWHPRTTDNLNEIQKKNLSNDKFKKELAEKNGYIVIYIYENELDDFLKKSREEFFYFIQAERKDVEKLVVEYGS